jgi:putrescine aminotransferase
MLKNKILGQWGSERKNSKKEVIKTEGYKIYYKNKKDYNIDIMCGYGAFMLGYNNKEILDKINQNYNVAFLRGKIDETCQQQEELAEIITSEGNWSAVAWAVSGSDAVEAAMAMVDNYYRLKEGNHRKKVIVLFPCYVGTTMWGKHTRKDYDYWGRVVSIWTPLWKTYDCRLAEEEKSLNEIRKVLREDNNKEIGSILIESCPWMAGVFPWSENFWREIKKICDEFDILWVVDDVAVCWGKTGEWYGWQSYGIQPDISALGKGITAGYSPLGVAVCNEKVYEVLSTSSWEHGHTWHPNMHAVVTSIEITRYIEKYNLLSKVSDNNKRLKNIADSLNCNMRGDYSMVTLDIDAEVTSQDFWDYGLSTSEQFPLVSKGQTTIVCPLIADEEYFDTIKTRLTSLLTAKNLL